MTISTFDSVVGMGGIGVMVGTAVFVTIGAVDVG